MNYKSFVFVLGLVIMSSSCLYAQNKGKLVKKGVEEAKKVSGKSIKVPNVPNVSKVSPAAGKTLPKVTGGKPAVTTLRTVHTTTKFTPLSELQVMQKAAPTATDKLKPAGQGGGTMVSVGVITQENTLRFLTQQAERERRKAVKNSSMSVDILSDSSGDYWADTKEPYIEATQQDYEEYAQSVRELLRPTQEKMRERVFRQEKFGGKTYTSALELAEDIAMDNLRDLEAPPCFYKIEKTDHNYYTDGGIGYVLELPADGIVLKKADGTKQILDPKTQVVFYAPLPYIDPGKYAQVIERTDLENPHKYYWLSPRPDKKFNRAMVSSGIPYGFGLTKEHKEARAELNREIMKRIGINSGEGADK